MYDPYNVYKGKYKEFIESLLIKRPKNSYFENSNFHHVIPFCCEGKDNDEENIRIYLTYSEHLIAHKLLMEENLDLEKLVYAYWCMCTMKGEEISPDSYELAQKEYRKIRRDNWLGSKNPKHLNPPIGEKNPMYGKPHPSRGKTIPHDLSEEGRISISKSVKARASNSRWYNNGSEERFVTLEDSEYYEMKGYTLGRLSKGKGNPTLRGFKQTEEFREKARLSSRRLDYHKVCKRCGIEFLGGKSARYCKNCSFSCH